MSEFLCDPITWVALYVLLLAMGGVPFTRWIVADPGPPPDDMIIFGYTVMFILFLLSPFVMLMTLPYICVIKPIGKAIVG